MKMDLCQVFELAGRRYAMLGPIYPSFGRVQLLDVVEVQENDYIAPNRIPESAEVSVGAEGPYAIVRSNDSAGHPYGRQTRTIQLAVTLSLADTASAQLEAIDRTEGLGLSGG